MPKVEALTNILKTYEMNQEPSRRTWPTIGRIMLKAALLFGLLNVLFAGLRPLPTLGALSLYNTLWPGRERLPYGENQAEAYNLSLNNIPAMFASHTISQPKAEAEFRVILLGDSGIWGWFLENEETVAGQLNGMGLVTGDGRTLKFYNLGYPIMSISKDLLLLEEALKYKPDLIIWPVTLESFALEKQLDHPILQNNPERMRPLIETYHLQLDPDDPRFVEPNFWQNSIVGQRRALADLLRLQQLGLAWGATGVDQAIPAEIPLRQSDFEADEGWQNFSEPITLTAVDLAFDSLAAGVQMAGEVPVLIVNEPIFVSDGRNSHLRYNLWYPRWAYDQYRVLLADIAAENEWQTLDLWDTIPPAEFSDTPVHLTPAGTAVFAAELEKWITDVISDP